MIDTTVELKGQEWPCFFNDLPSFDFEALRLAIFERKILGATTNGRRNAVFGVLPSGDIALFGWAFHLNMELLSKRDRYNLLLSFLQGYSEKLSELGFISVPPKAFQNSVLCIPHEDGLD